MKKSPVFSILLITLIACNNLSEEDKLIQKAKEIHENIITIDTHCDINVNNFTDERNYSQDLNSQITLPKMEEGGLDVAWLIVYTGQNELNEEGYAKAYQQAIDKFDAIHRLVKEYAPERIELAFDSEDVRRINKSGKKVAMIGVENGYPLGTDISKVREFYDRGARYMSFSHNGHSQVSDSHTGEEKDEWLHGGLSDFGKEVVVEMNKLGMMIDVSHPSKKTMKDIMELTKAPIIASHSSARALCNHSRNLDDEQLLWIKENGGVVQAVAFAAYLHTEKADKMRELVQREYEKQAAEVGFEILTRDEQKALSEEELEIYHNGWSKIRQETKDLGRIDSLYANGNPVNVSDLVDHIDYMVNKIGIEHVGISSDFDGGGGIYGWNDASETFNVTLELVRRGYTEEEIRMLWGENFLRVMDQVQSLADNS